MRSKAPLVMMEQMVMLLVFALAAALCLQAFVKSDQLSQQGEVRDRRRPSAPLGGTSPKPPRAWRPPSTIRTP